MIDDDNDVWSNRWNEWLAEKPKYLEKTGPSSILSTTNSALLEPFHRDGKPTTNCPTYGTAAYMH
jgi:hypothetical protein